MPTLYCAFGSPARAWLMALRTVSGSSAGSLFVPGPSVPRGAVDVPGESGATWGVVDDAAGGGGGASTGGAASAIFCGAGIRPGEESSLKSHAPPPSNAAKTIPRTA